MEPREKQNIEVVVDKLNLLEWEESSRFNVLARVMASTSWAAFFTCTGNK